MSKVIGLHFHELKPGVTEEELEKFIIEEMEPLSLEGVKRYSLKGDKGERKGQYLGLLVCDSVEVQDKYFGSPSGDPATEELPDDWKEALQKVFTLTTGTFTDYVLIE